MNADIQTIPELEAAIERLLEEEKKALLADAVTFHYYDEPYDRLILPIGLNLRDSYRFKSWLPSMDRIAGRIVKTGQPVVAEDAEQHPETTGPFVYAEGIKSSVGYPLVTSQSKKLGVFFANYREKHSFSPDQIASLQKSAFQIANSINDWLVQSPHLRTELSQLAGRRREAAALQEIADTIRNVMGSVAVAIWMPGRQSDDLVVVAQSGLREHVTRDTSLSLTKPCSIVNAFLNKSKVGGNIAEEQIFPEDQAKAMRLSAIWAYPILSLTRALGVVSVFPIDYDMPTPREETIIDAWIKQAAATIESHRNLLTLTTLHSMGRRLTSTLLDPQLLMQDIVVNAARVMDAQSVSLHQYNPVREEFHPYASSITYGIEAYPPLEKPRRGGISEYIVQHGLISVTDIQVVNPEYLRAPNVIAAGVKSYLGICLKADEDVVGVLFFNYNEKREFSPDDITIATTFANYAATAIHNSRIHGESIQRAKRLDLVRQVAAAVSSTTDINKILQLAVDGLARVFSVKQSAVALNDKTGEFAVVQREYLEAGCLSAMGHRIPLKDNPQIDRIRGTKKPLIVDDVQNDPIMIKTRDIMIARGTCSLIIVPIVIDEKVEGTIGVDSVGQIRHFTDEEADLAQAIADQVSIAIRNSRLLEEVTFRAEALRSLYEVGTKLTAISEKPEDLKGVLHRIAENACTVLNADLIELYQYDQTHNKFKLPPIRIGKLYRPDVVKKVVLEDDILYQVILLNEPKYTINALSDEILTREFEIDRIDRPTERYVKREKILASASIPLKVGDEKVGVMFANFRTPQHFNNTQKELIELFAHEAAIAIRNNRLYGQLQKSNQELDTIQKLMAKLTIENDLDELLQEFLRAIHGVLGFEYAIVALVDRGQNTIESRHGIWQGKINASPEWIKMSKYSLDDKDIMADIVRRGQAEIISEWDDRFNKQIWDKFDHDRLVRIFMPVKIQEDVIGVVEAGYEKKYKEFISAEERQTLQAFVDQAALAIQRTGQFQAISRSLEDRINDIRALQDITEKIHQGDLDEVLDLIAERAIELTGAKHSGVWLVNKTRTKLEISGLSRRDEYEHLPPSISLSEEDERSFSKLVVLSRESYLCGDVSRDENYKPWYPDTISELVVPIIYQERVIGTINVESPYENCFTDENQRLLEAMAGSAAIVVQNARLLERLNVLNDIGQELTSRLRLKEDEIVESIYNQAQRLTGALDMSIALYDEEAGVIRFALATERGRRIAYGNRKVDMSYRGKTEEIIFTRKSILHKTKKEAEEWYDQPGRSEKMGTIPPSWLGVPMILGNKVLGVIAIYDVEREYMYDEQDLQIFSSMASQSAIALDNAMLYYDVNQELQRRVDALASLNEVGRELTRDIYLHEEDILDTIYEQARRLTGTQDMYIALYEEEKKLIRFGLVMENGERLGELGLGGWGPRIVNLEKRGKTEEIIFTRNPILHYTQAEVEAWYQQPGHQEFIGRNLQSSYLGVPLLLGEQVLGVIALYDWENEHAYDEQDLQTIQLMADQAAIALNNTNLYYNVNKKLERRIEDLNALTVVGKTLSSSIILNEEDILGIIYEQARQLTGTKDMYIALYEEEKNRIRFGLAMEGGERLKDLGQGGWAAREADLNKRGKTEEIIITKRPILHRTRAEAEIWYKQPGHQEFIGNLPSSWLGVPLLLGERVLGVIALYDWEKEWSYDEEDQQIIQVMADQAAVALNNATLYEQEKQAQTKIVEREAVLSRTSFAADFVHRINNLTGTIPAWVDLIRDHLREKNVADLALDEYLNNIEDEADNLLREAEKLKSPPQLTQVDVGVLLQSLVRQAKVQLPATANVELQSESQLPTLYAVQPELANAFWNIIENGLDAMKYSGHLNIDVKVIKKDWLEVQISDEGPGIPEDKKDNVYQPFVTTKNGHMGYGLWRAKYVFENLKGSIDFKNNEPQGTTFIIRLPASQKEDTNV